METTLATCNLSSLEEYIPSSSNPWNKQTINHLYRRVAFGIIPNEINETLLKTPSQVVDDLIDEAVTIDPTPAPVWGYWYKDEILANDRKLSIVTQEWREQMVEDCLENNLRERLTLFWSNHFVTQYTSIIAGANVYQYYNVLQRHAIGNFRDFTREIGLSTAMLDYLNGNENSKDSPNENYARELYELFTLGVDNGYTQDDITETARALTGYNTEIDRWGPFTFDKDDFDDGEKTIFGQTGNWGYDDVIDILFDTHADKIAVFICGKLYQYFVDQIIDDAIVSELAEVFLANDFELEPVLRMLFKSQHFFDTATYGVIIKSPMDLLVSFVKEGGFTISSSFPILIRIRNAADDLGQSLFNPIDVAGWQGDKDWIASNTLINRWDTLSSYLRQAQVGDESAFQTLAISLMGGDQTANDVELISKTIIDHYLPVELLTTAVEYKEGLTIFKRNVPSNYFEDGSWNLSWDTVSDQVYDLLNYIITIPEFQLK